MPSASIPSAPRPARSPRLGAAIALGAALALAVAGCSGASTGAPSPSGAPGPGAGASAQAVSLIDVRTPEEYAEGHLEGAINIDIAAEDFTSRIQGLDPGASYQVYCRSGSRSARAVAAMREAGLTQVTDLGGIQEAASTTGLATVTEQ
ncbi:rhodanese-like domain-containing protein [Actinomyces bowdenii]|uniref:rhodanese-like domain-containing protein n=1 Tax=Actinomyces bowdenii TaxID=131109 RepID=UPI001ABD09F6|nr:rhodanese-like domain-containing protein [Actinomyces bowdenii]MBO3725190.1 rhodanese-like domain-containing protein [Actinomyces bowdenii]